MKNLEQTNNPIYLSEEDILKRISAQLDHNNDPKKGRIALKSFFQVLRANLPSEKSRQLLTMLPNPLLVAFVEGWQYNEKAEHPFECVDGMIEAYRLRRSQTKPDGKFSSHEAAKEIQVMLSEIKSLMNPEDVEQLHEMLPCQENQSFRELVGSR